MKITTRRYYRFAGIVFFVFLRLFLKVVAQYFKYNNRSSVTRFLHNNGSYILLTGVSPFRGIIDTN